MREEWLRRKVLQWVTIILIINYFLCDCICIFHESWVDVTKKSDLLQLQGATCSPEFKI